MKLILENWRSYLNELETDTGEASVGLEKKSMYEKDREVHKVKVEREIRKAKKKYSHSLSVGRSYKKIIEFLVRTTKLSKQEAKFHYLGSILPALLHEIKNVKYDFEQLPGKTTYGAFTVEGGARIIIDVRFTDPWHEDWKRWAPRSRATEKPTLENTYPSKGVPWPMGVSADTPAVEEWPLKMGGNLVLTTFIHELGHFIDYLWTTEKIKYPGKACDALPYFDMHSDREWKMQHCTPAELQRKDLGRLYKDFLELTYGERKTGKLTRTKAEYKSDLHEAAAHVREIFITLDRDVTLKELKLVCEFKEWTRQADAEGQAAGRPAIDWEKISKTWQLRGRGYGGAPRTKTSRMGTPLFRAGWDYSLLFKNQFIQQLNCKRLTKERVDALNRVTKVDPSKLPGREYA